jgi:predicted CXXCH cytochrome family protein
MQLLKNHIFTVLVLALVIFTWSCSPKTLSVFFDGVPDPEDSLAAFPEQNVQNAAIAASDPATAGGTSPRYYFHSPYQQKECAACHSANSFGKLLEPPPGLCYQCHEDFSTTFLSLHVPVEAGECMTCHKPHMADNRYFLIMPVQQLCYECHDKESILHTEYHAHILDNDCTDCHNPHGGNKTYFLK